MERPVVEVGVLEAKTRLSQLLQAALDGEQVVITRHGKRLVRLQPVAEDIEDRRGGGASEGGRRPILDVAEHVRLLREKFARDAPNPEAADVDGDLARMRGRV